MALQDEDQTGTDQGKPTSVAWLLLLLSEKAIGLAEARQSVALSIMPRMLRSVEWLAGRQQIDIDLGYALKSWEERNSALDKITEDLTALESRGLVEHLEETARPRYTITEAGEAEAARLTSQLSPRVPAIFAQTRKEAAIENRMRHLVREVKIRPNLSKLQNLAEKAQPEDWDYRETRTIEPMPILASYLNYLYRTVKAQAKVLTATSSEGKRYACFNTRLMTEHFQRLYAVMKANTMRRNPRDPEWELIGFFEPSHRLVSVFPDEPEPPTFFQKPAELLYDLTISLRIGYEHVLGDNVDRFPSDMRGPDVEDWDKRHRAVDTAVDRAKRRLELNYKTAIPQFYFGRDGESEGKLQLLLPLCLQKYEKADLALVVAREEAAYLGHTCLTLDMAYNNARLIARPDTEWLNP